MEEMRVRSVYAGEEDQAFVVAFEVSADEALVFQLANRLDDQDAMLAMDSYSISTGAGATVYGGVTSAAVTDSVLVFGLTDQAAAALGVDGDVRLRLPGDVAVETAIAGLRRMGISVRS